MFKGIILTLFCIFKKIFDAVFYITVAVFIMKYFGLFVIYEQLDKQVDYKDLFIFMVTYSVVIVFCCAVTIVTDIRKGKKHPMEEDFKKGMEEFNKSFEKSKARVEESLNSRGPSPTKEN